MPTVTLRPSADGALLECRIYPTTPTTHYDKVDEVTPNDSTDYVAGQVPGEGYFRDSYVKPSSGIPAGSTINSVTIYNRLWTPLLDAVSGAVATLLRNAEGSLAIGTDQSSYVWVTRSTTYTTSPFTGSAWTVDEVEGLQIGTRCLTVYAEDLGYIEGACSTVWLVINYTPLVVVKRPVWECKTRGGLISLKVHFMSTLELGSLPTSGSPLLWNSWDYLWVAVL